MYFAHSKFLNTIRLISFAKKYIIKEIDIENTEVVKITFLLISRILFL